MNDIKDLITIDILNECSLFGIAVIDLATYGVIYTNKAMEVILADQKATSCWESIYGESSPCKWCKVPSLNQKSAEKSITYELFNEVNSQWYQIENRILDISEELRVLIYFYVDISMQKEAQGELIQTHVRLSIQSNKLEQAQQELKEMAYRDPLTNLYNRRYFFDFSQELIQIAKRDEEELSVIMIDIDKFKNINDTYGHAIGDSILKLLASKLTQLSRASDVTARIGGEEFVVLFPKTSEKNAYTKAENIRGEIEALSFELEDGGALNFTISIGLSCYQSSDDTTINEILKRADSALYKAKESGRNKVITYRDEK